MFKSSHKDSDHQNLYGNQKAITEMPALKDENTDPLYKFKRNVALSTSYELYL